MPVMSGPLPKPADRRQRRNVRPELQVVDGGGVGVRPEPDDGWPPEVVEGWWAAWDSPQASGWSTEMLPVVRRVFDLRARLMALDAVWSADPIVAGSQGQDRPNPAFNMARDLRAQLLALEDRLGLNLKAKVAMGMQAAQIEDRSLTGRAQHAAKRAIRDPRS